MAKRRFEVVLAGDAKSLARAFGQAGKDAEGFGGKVRRVGRVAAAGLAVVATAAIGAGAAAFAIGSQFDDAYDTIRVGTGATGEALGELQDSFRDVVASVPTDFASASTAIADLNTRLGAEGPLLEDLSKQYLELSRITDSELGANIESVTRVMGDWGVAVESQSDAMDRLFRASQATGPSVSELSTLMTQFGSPLRQLGFSFDEAAALIGQFQKEGVNTELVLGSMRQALGRMARDGEPAIETFNRVTEEIANAGDASEANRLALELFGARAGPDMAAAIREGRFEIGDLVDTIANGSDTIAGAGRDTMDFAEQWTLLKNNVLLAIEPIATRVFSAVGDAAASLAPMVQGLAENVAGLIAEWGPRIEGFVTGALARLQGWWEDNGPAIVGFVTDLADAIGSWIEDVAPAIRSWVEDVLGELADWWETWGPGIVELVEEIRDAVARMAEGVVRAVQTVHRNWDNLRIPIAVIAGLIASVLIPHFVALGVQAVASSIKQGAAWVATQAGAIRSAVVHSAQIAKMVAGWVLMGAQSLLHAAKVAAAWLIAMGPIALVIAAVIGLVAIIVANWETITAAISAAWDWVAQKTSDAWNWVTEKISGVVAWFRGVPGQLRSAAGDLFGFVRTKATEAKDWVGNRINDIVGFFTGLPGRISGAAGDVFGFLWQSFRNAVNRIIDGWNGLEFRIPGFDPPGPGPTFGGFTLGLPNIPRLAQGAVIDQTTLAWIGEDQRTTPEIVTPEALMREVVRDEIAAVGSGGGVVIENATFGDRRVVADLDWWAQTRTAGV